MSPRERVRRVRTGVVDRGVPAETVPAGEPIGPVGGRVYPKAVLAWGQVTVGVEEEGRCSRRDGTDLRLGGSGTLSGLMGEALAKKFAFLLPRDTLKSRVREVGDTEVEKDRVVSSQVAGREPKNLRCQTCSSRVCELYVYGRRGIMRRPRTRHQQCKVHSCQSPHR